MTINEAVEKALITRPDTFSDEMKTGWINELEGKIYCEVMKKPFVPFSFPEDFRKNLFVKEPYCNIYPLYIICMSDFYSSELNNYSASAGMFLKAYEDFAKHYIRENMPPQKNIRLQG